MVNIHYLSQIHYLGQNSLNVKMAHVERQGESKDRQEMKGEVQKFIKHRWSIVGEYEVGCILEGFG